MEIIILMIWMGLKSMGIEPKDFHPSILNPKFPSMIWIEGFGLEHCDKTLNHGHYEEHKENDEDNNKEQ